MLCANESALRVYLRTVDQEERRIDLIEKRTEALMLDGYTVADVVGDLIPEFSPATQDTASILISQIAIEEGTRPEVADRLRIQLSKLIERGFDGYRRKLAKAQAEDQIDNASCHHCLDEGCRRCHEEYEQ